MPAKLSNAARHRKSLARHGTLIPKNWLPHFHEGPSLISMTITSRAPLRPRLRTDAPSNQRSPPSPTKSPASPVKNPSLKRHPKLKPFDANKFRIGSIHKLLSGNIQTFRESTILKTLGAAAPAYRGRLAGGIIPFIRRYSTNCP